MIEIKEIAGEGEKSNICEAVLRALPSWFGNEQAIVDYADQVKALPFYAAFDGGMTIGFTALKPHNTFTFEICVMGILMEYHRRGIGKKLVALCERRCRESGAEFLTVKTLDASRESKSYARTRAFYKAMGFVPLEVFPLYWDKDNPCLFMAKHIKNPLEVGDNPPA